MKSYAITQPESATAGDPVQNPVQKSRAGSKEYRKTIFALVALAVAAILLVKLQKPETAENAPLSVTSIPQQQKAVVVSKKKAAINPESKPSKKAAENFVVAIKPTITWRKNLLGESVLTGTLQNTAAYTNFNNPVILVSWLSKQENLLGTSTYPIKQSVNAGNTINFKLKVKAPFKYDQIKVTVASASASQD
jgi:hypothetical protein